MSQITKRQRFINTMMAPFFVMNFSNLAFAQATQLTPDQLVQKSRESAAAMIAACAQIEIHIINAPDKSGVMPYLRILPELTKIALDYGLQDLGTRPDEVLGYTITKSAIKFMKWIEDSDEEIEIFLRYAEDASRYSVIYIQREHFYFVSDISALLNWNKKINFALDLLRKLKTEVQGQSDLCYSFNESGIL